MLYPMKTRANEKPSSAALRLARQKWGDEAFIKDRKTPTSAEQRQAANTSMSAARNRMNAIDAEVKARLAELDWYQALMHERETLKREKDAAQVTALTYRCTVGKGLRIMGQGDTWDEAFAQADRWAVAKW
jgi:hypothetical protein